MGDELTWDYALNIWEEWIGPLPCHCGAENCRRIIRGNYFTLPREIQRRYLPLLDEPFKKRFAKEIRSLQPDRTQPSGTASDYAVRATKSRTNSFGFVTIGQWPQSITLWGPSSLPHLPATISSTGSPL